MMAPNLREGILNSPHGETEGATTKRSPAWEQKLSLIVAGLFVVFYLLSSLWIGSHRRFWYDEIFTVLLARMPDTGTIWKALAGGSEVQPPSYYMLVRLFDGAFGPEEFAARIPSALALAAGLLIVFDCARRLTDNLHALASLALLSCSLLPYYGYEARPYSLYFTLAAAEMWLWFHAPNNRRSAVLFGVTAFLAFSMHYYTVFCLVPYGVFEVSRWKPWKAPSAKLLAGILGVLCGAAVFSRQIVGARGISSGFWAPPSVGALVNMFGEFFPYGMFIGAAVLMWVAWTSRAEKPILEPMLDSERVGWYFLSIPFAGYVVAELVTNAFYNRYFIGMLPGVAAALACLLWRHFHRRPGLSAGIVALMLLLGAGHQISVMTRSWAIEPPSYFGGAARLRDALAWEAVGMNDGKKSIAVPADGAIGVEARYYSKHPERYVFVLTPRMRVVGRVHQNFARFHPMRFWSLEDLRVAARDTALLDPSDEMLKAMTDAGFQIKPLPAKDAKIVYLE